jgi:lincosamide nucleotidyltransferase A/C/D/E
MNESLSRLENAAPRQMRADQAAELIRRFETADLEVWLDGGWGVDALLGAQTRPHGDLDIVIRESDMVRMERLFADSGFARAEGGDPWNFVLSDRTGREIDAHVVTFDEEGNGLYGPAALGKAPYPAEAFLGRGFIDGVSVRCMTAEYQMKSHTGYEPDEDDFKDVLALNRQFGIPVPALYRKRMETRGGGA